MAHGIYTFACTSMTKGMHGCSKRYVDVTRKVQLISHKHISDVQYEECAGEHEPS